MPTMAKMSSMKKKMIMMLPIIGTDLSSETTRIRNPVMRLIVRSGRSTRKTRRIIKPPTSAPEPAAARLT